MPEIASKAALGTCLFEYNRKAHLFQLVAVIPIPALRVWICTLL